MRCATPALRAEAALPPAVIVPGFGRAGDNPPLRQRQAGFAALLPPYALDLSPSFMKGSPSRRRGDVVLASIPHTQHAENSASLPAIHGLLSRAGDNPPFAAHHSAGLFASSLMLTLRLRSGSAYGGPNSFRTNLSRRYPALRTTWSFEAQDCPINLLWCCDCDRTQPRSTCTNLQSCDRAPVRAEL